MKEKKRYFLLLLLLLGSAGFLVLSLEDPPPRKAYKKVSPTSPKTEALINKHLWQTNQLKEQAELKVQAQNSYMAPKVGEAIAPTNRERFKNGVDHSPDTNETNVYQDLNRDRREYRLSNPDHQIQSQLYERDRMKEYEKSYREEYARQFIENARRNGYEVKLNSDFVVIQVKPIQGFHKRGLSSSSNDRGELGPQAK